MKKVFVIFILTMAVATLASAHILWEEGHLPSAARLRARHSLARSRRPPAPASSTALIRVGSAP